MTDKQQSPQVAALVAEQSDVHWQNLLDKGFLPESLLSQDHQNELKCVLGLSDYIATQLCRHPEWISELFAGQLEELDRQAFMPELKAELSQAQDEDSAKAKLRRFRNRQMVRLAWRDYLGYVRLEDSLLDLSALAESLVIGARDWLYDSLCKQYGTPMDSEGNPQPLLILGMGKLGGRELNFSSDIDLIFTFPEHGETVGGRRALDNQQFFIRMGQKLVSLLDQVTVDGFVYRVDMRLRPYGESGPLVVSFSALEDYYQEQGRDWERYAMVKARALGPWTEHSDALHTLLRPFVYRRYIDFSAIESLRKMKKLIAQEVRRRQLTNNIKLGAGGIREVEFVVQSFQLIRGGCEPALRQQSLFAAIQTLYDLGQFEYLAVDELKRSYILLRRIENLLQALDDKQTQTLPDNELDWQRLCYAMKVSHPEELKSQIEAAMAKIHYHFEATVGEEGSEEKEEHWSAELWLIYEDEDAQTLLRQNHCEDEKLWSTLSRWREEVGNRSIGPRGRETLDKLMPKLLEIITEKRQACDVFAPVAGVIDKIVTRTTYLELLCENPGARQQLVSLCSASPWIAKQLAKFPMLLDELIDPAHLYDTTSLDDYGNELRQYLMRVPEEDMEQQMEALRQFKLSQQLKIAAADVTGVLPVMQVSDHLTFLAEAIIEQVVNQAWLQVSARHGVPMDLAEGEKGFAVIGYGKAGGLELGYGSDLDLVFLHRHSDGGQTNGDRAIDVNHFYLKLAQRILHLFSTRTNSGELYEVDMRLRPSGASGLLVSEIERFGEYQQTEAWTWEHQALVRARFMFGDNALSSRFSQIRSDVLSKVRDKTELQTQVREMRKKMRDHLLTDVDEGMFNLKQSAGGIADIEFIAQFLVLANAAEHRELTTWSDNVRIFAVLAELEIIPVAMAQQLTQVYCKLRNESHRLTLQHQSSNVELSSISQEAEAITCIYADLLGVEGEQEVGDK